jgi:hypothetical protein
MSAVLGQLIGAIVSADDAGDVSQRLGVLVGRPTEIAAGHGGFDQVNRVFELSVEVEKYRSGMRLQRTHHLHGISWRVVIAVERSRQRTAGGEVSVSAIAGSAHALEFSDKVARAAVDGLASERSGQSSGRGVDKVDGWITRRQRLIDSRHIGREKLRETSVKKKPFADGIFRGRGICFRWETGRITRAATQHQWQYDQ